MSKLDNLLKQSSSPKPAQALDINQVTNVAVRVDDLREALTENPDHPIAQAISMGIAELGSTATVTVDLVDLQAIAEDKLVRTELVDTDFGQARKKVLGDARTKTATKKKPTK